MKGLLFHKESEYAKGIGMLYLRYVAKPDTLWDWYLPLLEDQSEIQVTSHPRPRIITIAEFARELLTSNKYSTTTLPRIPVPIERKILKNFADYDRQEGEAEENPNGPEIADPHKIRRDYSHDRNSDRGDSKSSRARSRSPTRGKDRERNQDYSPERSNKNHRAYSRERSNKSHRDRSRDRSSKSYRDRSRDRSSKRYRDRSYDNKRIHSPIRDRSTRDYRDGYKSKDERYELRVEYKPDRSKNSSSSGRISSSGYTLEEERYDEFGRLKKKKL
ncbi:Pre-mRNA-splicing factor 38B [Smittium mucronatum]|uniref:Pre-mRNA-splicing factor 38 n=1 Tax=Smittium mucronatum TaxID=133383 RepID=A0A1R0H2V7_9FUNG|nr:Pre-mRNA-splicing factor 38B [Smittium mucronatum]